MSSSNKENTPTPPPSSISNKKQTPNTNTVGFMTVNSQKSFSSSLADAGTLPSFTCGQILFDDGQQRLRQVF